MSDVTLTVIEVRRKTCLGDVTYVKIRTKDYRRLGWEEIWSKFAEAYPGKWAVECFPPASELVNGKCVYHLFVLDGEPQGLNIR